MCKIPKLDTKHLWVASVSVLLCMSTAAFWLLYRRKK